MVILVVTINTFISLILLYIALQVWQLKQRLASVADSLTAYEICTHTTLHQAPENIYLNQQNIYNLRQRNQALQIQIQQVQQIISLILLGRQIWQRYFQRRELTPHKTRFIK
ncbi:hypothetical protein A6S26_08670 [Nostoc sp. ATCC 43529]|nr:hypothetical protein A6S26_08670 [Nostoc sp. ATCC 43529]